MSSRRPRASRPVWLDRFNKGVPWPLRAVMIVAAGLGAFFLLTTPATLAAMKLSGNMRECPWARAVTAASDSDRLGAEMDKARTEVSVQAYDPVLEIDRVKTSERSFWIKHKGAPLGGQRMISFLMAEHRWMIRSNEPNHVRKGDVVFDCGAHVGVFTHHALARGASKVIAVEPEPVNIECFRRNFTREIADGRVVLIPKGVWSSETTLELSIADRNSGMNSIVSEQGGKKVGIAVTTIDRIVAELGLPRVDFVKMDIEGAEREALKGASGTLRRWRPRLMMDSYHRPDDPVVLRRLLREFQPGYREICGPCEPYGPPGATVQWLPHVTYYE